MYSQTHPDIENEAIKYYLEDLLREAARARLAAAAAERRKEDQRGAGRKPASECTPHRAATSTA